MKKRLWRLTVGQHVGMKLGMMIIHWLRFQRGQKENYSYLYLGVTIYKMIE